MKMYWEVELQLHTSLSSALDGGMWSASPHGPHWLGGRVGLRDGLNAVVKRKIPSSCRDSNPWSSSAIPLSYPGS